MVRPPVLVRMREQLSEHVARVANSVIELEWPGKWKDAEVAPLWKKKGSRSQIGSYRDITLCNEDSKVLATFNRSSILHVVMSLVQPTAMGSGLNGGACDSAHLIVIEVLAEAMKRNLCGYTIFADVRTAFATLHRNISMMSDEDGDEIWMKHLIKCGSDGSQAASIMALACDLTMWTHHGGSAHSFAMLREAHNNTWFSTEGLNRCVVFF